MKIFIDHCLSPTLAQRLCARGIDATCARDRAMAESPDYKIRDYCLKEDRIIVTQNAGDFRKLVGKTDVHPGLIILEENSLDGSWNRLQAALKHIKAKANPTPADYMVNRVIEVGANGRIRDYPLP